MPNPVLLAAAALFALPTAADGASAAHGGVPPKPFVLVAHAAVRDVALTRDQASRIFLKQAPAWPSGAPARPVDLRGDAPARATFVQTVHRRRPQAVEAWWQQQIFSGRDTPPPVRANDAAVLAYVRTTPGAVGYVSAQTALGPGVHAVELVP